jgi:hypothetical protein
MGCADFHFECVVVPVRRLGHIRQSTSSGPYITDHNANTALQRLTVRLTTWSRVERCSMCQAVATRCQWAVPHEELSLSSLVSMRTSSIPFKADLVQTHAWAAVQHDTSLSATSAMHDPSPGPTYKTSTPASDMYHPEVQMRPNK